MVVLIHTQWFDPTADHVIAELNAREVPVFRFDSADFPLSASLSVELGAAGWLGTIKNSSRRLCLSDVTGIYNRRPSAFQFPHGMSGAERGWAGAEARMGLGGILSAMNCWLNHPARMAAAEFKPVQLDAAVQAGLHVPRTIVTSEPDYAAEFAESVGQVIYKPLASPSFESHGRRQLIYASPVRPEDLPDPAIRLTAHLFQEWIEHVHAVRVTVIDGKFFASAIYAGSDAGRIDWRSDYSALTYDATEVPKMVRQGVLILMSKLSLRFGALDFLVTPSGDWVFLEINPNGQWAWIEDKTGLPIAAAIADALEGGSEK
jgi:ATP-grasp ribosomal peptide maturase